MDVPYDAQMWSDILVCTEGPPAGKKNGKLCNQMKPNLVNKARGEWWNAYDCLQKYLVDFFAPGSEVEDTSISEVLSACNWNPTSEVESNERYLREIYEWYDTTYEFAQENTISGLSNYPLTAFDDFQDKSFFLSFKDAGKKIVDSLIEEAGITDNKIVLGKVTKIDWNVNPVMVETDVAGTYCAPKVLVTVSQGLLASGSIVFDPPLDDATAANGKLIDMENIYGEMATYVNLDVQFKDRFWGDTQFIFLTKPSRSCRVWQSLDTGFNEFFPGSHVVRCALLGSEFRKLATDNVLLQETVNTDIIEPLKKAFGVVDDYTTCEKTSPPFLWDPADEEFDLDGKDCRFRVFDKQGDEPWPNELWGGAYSNYKVFDDGKNVLQTDRYSFEAYNRWTAPIPVDSNPVCTSGKYPFPHEELKLAGCCPGPDEPGKPSDYCRLHFAGEANCDRHGGWAHGAYMTGIREGLMIWEELTGKVPPDPSPQFCEFGPSGGHGNPLPHPSKSS